jgi:hypothetical protein
MSTVHIAIEGTEAVVEEGPLLWKECLTSVDGAVVADCRFDPNTTWPSAATQLRPRKLIFCTTWGTAALG